jgi:hypothetical protein
MTKREDNLQRQLDEAKERIAALENRRPEVVVVNAPPVRNALQSISDWWHGGSTAGARTRHMRVDY